MKKTPLQQLIDRLEDTLIDAKFVTENPKGYDYRDVQECHKQIRYVNICIHEATELLEEEKQMVIDAFNSGAQEMDDWYSNPRGGTKSSEQYFNQTFTTNDD